MNTPLVSIVVVTYNSAKYVLDTLESAKKQTYSNIELIISDDCSKDDTVSICDEWLAKNSSRFCRTQLITSKQNTGIGKNCNRGLFASTGEWIKLIAGDDVLIETCVEDLVEAAKEHKECYIFHSLCRRFRDLITDGNELPQSKYIPTPLFRNNDVTQKQQYESLMISCPIAACTVMINAQILKNLGGYEEKVRVCEDWPTWIKLSQAGYKFFFVGRTTVKYRVHSESVYSGSMKDSVFPMFYMTDKKVYKLYIKSIAPFSIRFYWSYMFIYKDIMVALGMTKRNCFNRFLDKIFNKIGYILKKCIEKRIARGRLVSTPFKAMN